MTDKTDNKIMKNIIGGIVVGFIIGLSIGGMWGIKKTRNAYRSEACKRGYVVGTVNINGDTQWMWANDVTNSVSK